jgi:hypothetical protein
MRRALLAPLLLCCGCFHVHLERNAPGEVDLSTPPEPGERPEDPGERMLVVSAGPFATGGATLGGPSSTRAVAALGVEASVQLGENERSHADDSFFVWPMRSVGLNLGATFLGTERSRSAGTLYAELQASEELAALAWGWAVEPGGGTSGPQLSMSIGPLLLRGAYFGSAGGELGVGLVIKGAGVWVWSQ